jgi:putative phage-type endonuclease
MIIEIEKEIEEEEHVFNITETEEVDIINTCIHLMYDYINENPTSISEPDFHEVMIENCKDLLWLNFEIGTFFGVKNDVEEEDLYDIIKIASKLFYLHIMPKRSYSDTFETKLNDIETKRIIQRLTILKNTKQNVQRTKEWYETRHKLITASNAYKAFENESTQNQLIYEKCQPIRCETSDVDQHVNINTAMHWGQKYEPVSVMYYEYTFKTVVSEYGCIQHDIHSFLGASPDGIIEDSSLPNFGRMIEIKNIVNREIDGIPKKEYWIQMQLQMETCDLNECDFLETRFTEYLNYNEFISDGFFLTSKSEDYKGIIMYFSYKSGNPLYIYKPFEMEEDFFNYWEQDQIKIQELNGLTWIKNIYWKLEEVSCVLVLRNNTWFQNNIEQLTKIWNTILEERETGYTHRAPSKRVKKDIIGIDLQEKCLIKMDTQTNKISIV